MIQRKRRRHNRRRLVRRPREEGIGDHVAGQEQERILADDGVGVGLRSGERHRGFEEEGEGSGELDQDVEEETEVDHDLIGGGRRLLKRMG